MELKLYRCKHCGQIVAMVKEKACSVMCCGEAMEELVPGTSDGAHEKHVPVCRVEDGIVHVNVGEVDHPMLEEHYIEWIAIETKQGLEVKNLNPGELPKADFVLSENDELVAVYEYCNLHGLWKYNV